MLFFGSWLCVAHAQIVNFGEPNTTNLTRAIANRSFHLVQLGDSHTAGDVMTEAVRERLQGVMGDGGMGWAMPMYFGGQRMARFGYDNTDFLPISSRTNFGENYTLGGMLATPKVHGATLTLKPKRIESAQRLLVRFRQSAYDGRFILTDATGRSMPLELPRKDGTWQFVSVDARLPLMIYNDNASGSAIGGFWAFSPTGRGAVVSAIGINGSELSHWSRWNASAWQNELATIRPNLIVLAYGTNEAHNGASGNYVQSILTQKVRQIRRASPNSAVMIVSAPETLRSITGECGTRPAMLSEIQMAQRAVAQSERTLFWDWQLAMGGSCTMKSWINVGEASKDGVHFSQSGYAKLGNRFANDLLSFANVSSRTTTTLPQSSRPSTSTPTTSVPTNQGYIYIERAN